MNRETRSTCLGCDRSVEGKDYLCVGEAHFPVCGSCQDQLSKYSVALRAALREILVLTR